MKTKDIIDAPEILFHLREKIQAKRKVKRVGYSWFKSESYSCVLSYIVVAKCVTRKLGRQNMENILYDRGHRMLSRHYKYNCNKTQYSGKKRLAGPINAVNNYFLVCEAIFEWNGNKQPSDPRASLLLTVEKAIFCNYKYKDEDVDQEDG